MSQTLGELVGSLRVDALERPAWAMLALAMAALALWLCSRRKPEALPWPAWPEARAAGARWRDWPDGASRALRVSVLVLLGVVLAGPIALRPSASARETGLDLLLVVDASASMRALDTKVRGEWRTRLDLAREVVKRFATQRVGKGDRVGLVVFGESAFTQCPLTRDGRLLADALGRVEAGMAGEATALGDALTLAVKRVAASSPMPRRSTAPGEGRVVVLLTDGRSNAGAVPPDFATAIAAGRGVRVHTVGIGSEGEVPMARAEGSARRSLRFERHDLDPELLSRIAAATGGRFFEASSSRDLEAVYAEIDALERTERPVPESPRPTPRPEPLLALAGLLLICEVATLRGFARRIP